MSYKDLVYPLLAALCYSTNPILVKMGLRISNEPMLGASIGILASTVVYTVYFLLSGQVRNLLAAPWQVKWYFGLAGIGSTLGVFTFFAALERIPAAIVSSLVAVAPLVTLTLSYFVLRQVEQVTPADGIGTVLIVLGVVLLVS
jgi:bacterial/archaeal transporter family protein